MEGWGTVAPAAKWVSAKIFADIFVWGRANLLERGEVTVNALRFGLLDPVLCVWGQC